MALKTKTSKAGFPMPQHERDREVCQLKWKAFYLTQEDLETACINTILDYAASCAEDESVTAYL